MIWIHVDKVDLKLEKAPPLPPPLNILGNMGLQNELK